MFQHGLRLSVALAPWRLKTNGKLTVEPATTTFRARRRSIAKIRVLQRQAEIAALQRRDRTL